MGFRRIRLDPVILKGQGLRPAGAGRAALVFAALVLASVLSPADPVSPPRILMLQAEPARPSDAALASLLAKASEYCRRLEAAAFDLVCREEVLETIDPKLEATLPAAPAGPGDKEFLGPSLVISKVRKIRRSHVYDLHCVRAGRTIRETREELGERGLTKTAPNAEPPTTAVDWGAAFLGPVGLFGEAAPPGYDFRLAGEERIGDVRAVVVETKPKPGTPAGPRLYGKAWIDPATGAILEIEWSEARVGNVDVFARRGELFKRTPRLTLRAEFGVEKNGLRFPSRLTVEEAYLAASGKVFVRSTTEAVYRDFKFFTVEVEH